MSVLRRRNEKEERRGSFTVLILSAERAFEGSGVEMVVGLESKVEIPVLIVC